MTYVTDNRKTTMRAATYRAYGPPEAIEHAEVPVPDTGDNDVLVRVHAAAVNPGDYFSLLGRPWVVRLATGLSKPRQVIPGRAFAGTVESLGHGATRFRPGDEIYGEISGGAYAEFASVDEKSLARKPRNATFEEAAAVPISGVTALQGLRDVGRVTSGASVLINGASGGVGTMAVQIARALGAEVTAVCRAENAEMMASLGAHHLVDYTKEDFTRHRGSYDVVFDVIGNHSLIDIRRSITRSGTLVLSSGPPSPTIRRIFAALVLSPFLSQRLRPLLQKASVHDLDRLTQMVESGEVVPVVDRAFPLNLAAEALRYQGEGHARGRTVITMKRDG